MKHLSLGNGPTGVLAAETIRRHAPRDEILLVGDEREPPYSRMAIPYLLTGKIGEAGTHLRSYTVSSEVMGVPMKTDPHVTEGKAGLVKAFQDATAVFDSAGICLFTSFAWTLADVAPQLAAACTEEYTLDELNLIGERIWNLERDFNNRAGFTAKDDSLPKRLTTEPAKTGPAKGKVNGLDKMLPEYYELRGWDKTGQLKPETRARLKL